MCFQQACAHRYRIINRVSGYSWGKGICILFSNNFYPDQLIEPCDNYAIIHDFRHEQCQCQAGTSSSVTAVSHSLHCVCFWFSYHCHFWTRKARVPKATLWPTSWSWNQFSKGPKVPKALLIRSGAQRNFVYTFVLTDLPSQIFHLFSN